MSDELFPEDGGTDYEYEDEDEEGQGAFEKVKQLLESILESGGEKEQGNEDESISFLDDGEEGDEEDKDIMDQMDRFTALVIGVEVVLVVYFLLAILGFAPFF
jgi:hypothetical protein